MNLVRECGGLVEEQHTRLPCRGDAHLRGAPVPHRSSCRSRVCNRTDGADTVFPFPPTSDLEKFEGRQQRGTTHRASRSGPFPALPGHRQGKKLERHSPTREGRGRTWAKAILLGEHSVVYGHPAVAVPLHDLQMRATATPGPGPSQLNCLDHRGPMEQTAPITKIGRASCRERV